MRSERRIRSYVTKEKGGMEMNPFRSLFLSLSRMPPILMLFIILGLAVVVTVLVTGKMNEDAAKNQQQINAMQAQQNEKTTVVYAVKDIGEGDVIAQDAVEERQVLKDKAPVDACVSASSIVGQTAAYPIAKETVMTAHAIKTAQVVTGFDSKVKDGMRACTIAIDANAGVAGFVQPGSHVDIIAITGNNETTKAAPVMSDVEVVASGTTYTKVAGQQAANAAGSVTLLVSPQDANKLIKAATAAKLYLTLRNDKDHTPVAVVDVTSMFPKAPKPAAEVAQALPPPSLPPPPLPGAPGDAGAGGPPPAPPPPPMHEIEVWTGGKKEVLSVPQG